MSDKSLGLVLLASACLSDCRFEKQLAADAGRAPSGEGPSWVAQAGATFSRSASLDPVLRAQRPMPTGARPPVMGEPEAEKLRSGEEWSRPDVREEQVLPTSIAARALLERLNESFRPAVAIVWAGSRVPVSTSRSPAIGESGVVRLITEGQWLRPLLRRESGPGALLRGAEVLLPATASGAFRV